MGFGPFLAGGVGHGEPGEVPGGVGGVGFRCRLGVHGIPGKASAVLSVLPVTLTLADLRLDIPRRDRESPVVRGHPCLELTAPHRPQHGLIVRQFQGHDGGAERLAQLRLAGGHWADRLCRVGDPGRFPVGLHDAGQALPVFPQRPGLSRRRAPRPYRPLRCLCGYLAAEFGLPGVEHPGGLPDRLRGVLRGPLSPGSRLAPRRGGEFSQAAVHAGGDRPEPGHRVGGDGVERVLDPAAADLVRPQRLQQRGPLRILEVSFVLAGTDPLADHLVYLRHDVKPPERLRDLQEVPGVRGPVLRGLHLLQRGPLRLVLLQRLGQDGLPWGALLVAGPVWHPQRYGPGGLGVALSA